jgi:molecular chaperone DnaJ
MISAGRASGIGAFGGGFGGGRSANPNAPRQGGDLEERVVISFEEAAKGCTRRVEVNRVEPCDDCGGSGAAKGSGTKTCAECGGTGQKSVQQRTPFGVIQSSKTCLKCGGRGKVVESPCQKCRGGGRVRKRITVPVTIPPGIDNGQAIRMGGEGNKGTNGGPAGDLIVGVSVRPHAVFERDGYDLWCDIAVQFWQAALGDLLNVPTLEGSAELRLPAGTQPGTVLSLRGRGIPVLHGGGRKGDLYLRIQVETPEALSPEQRALVEQMRRSPREYFQAVESHASSKGDFRNIAPEMGLSHIRANMTRLRNRNLFLPQPLAEVNEARIRLADKTAAMLKKLHAELAAAHEIKTKHGARRKT